MASRSLESYRQVCFIGVGAKLCRTPALQDRMCLSLPYSMTQIGRAHPPPNHSAHRHLSTNYMHLFRINILIRTSKAHTSLHSVSSLVYMKWTLSMLSKPYIDIPTMCTYHGANKYLIHCRFFKV